MIENPKPIINLAGVAPAAVESAAVNPLAYVLPLVTALVISMALIPVMVRLAPVLGMIDRPDRRKVHAMPVPRVGGAGIVAGALVPVALLLPLDSQLIAFLAGSLVLFLFGSLDDSRELGHYVKFIGQFIAVGLVVFYGDVYVTLLPFTGSEPIAAAVGRPFTFFAMVGMINAMNHSDGLDGLAGGESLLSLAGIIWLAYLAGGTSVVVIGLATVGGLFGFMRFNTHPARIFMGDSGSQFLGFTLGFLAVLLTQDVNPALSPALPALLLGLPVADIIAVLVQRIYKRMNWFRATRNHIHHRLLDLGFHHYESVVIVYTIQALLVLLGVLMPYETDLLLVSVYGGVVLSVFALLYTVERNRWMIRDSESTAYLDSVFESARYRRRLSAMAYAFVLYGLSLFVVSGSLISTYIPLDITAVAGVMLLMLGVRLVAGFRAAVVPLRLVLYMTVLLVVYLLNTYQPAYLSGADPVTYVFFAGMVACIALVIRFSRDNAFAVTPMDFLVVLSLIVLVVLAGRKVVESVVIAIALKSIIMFYACELVLARMQRRWNVFTAAALFALTVVLARGVMFRLWA